MSITSSGAFCDICDKYILPIGDEMVNFFGVKGIDRELHCHNDCKKILQDIKGDWKKLPEGNLRHAFEKADKEREGVK